MYLEQTPILIIAMKTSFKNKDWVALQATAHKMIPSFSIMGISVDFENMAKKVKEYATTLEETDAMPALVFAIGKYMYTGL